MDALRIQGGKRLKGEWTVQNAKNAALPIMAGAILTEGKTFLRDCPQLSDISDMGEILRTLGCGVHRNDGTLEIDPGGLCGYEMPEELSKRIRSSIFLLGPILARFRRANVSLPGGCEIGLRPIDLHLSGLRQLGVQMVEEGGVIRCDGRNMHPATVHFDYPSVGATENVMMAAALLRGETVLNNVAREPEILDLQRFLNAMGARIAGAGTNTIRVQGVSRLTGVEYRPMPDRIAAGTLLAAAAVTGGSVRLHNVPVEEMLAVIAKLEEMGCVISRQENALTLHGPERLTAFAQLQTQPHPGFPTDMQAQMMAAASLAKGTSVVVENVFENRFAHAGDLNRMGANILINGRTAVIRGVERLSGARVTARDLRGGAALAIAGLAAQGETVVERARLIDRGYEHLETALSHLGADIQRISAEKGEKHP